MNDLTTTTPRLPMPAGFSDADMWQVLTEAIFPNVRNPASIMLALKYCRARNLDIMKRPVNIVPVWNSQLGRNVDTIWPAITEIEITASRSKDWAGMDPEVLGPMVTETFKGRKEDRKKGWIDVEMEVTYPEFVRVTVYRMVRGQKCGFTETMYWKENYGRYRGGNLPNDMWAKRPRNQAIKVAKAFSLRAAFPEEAGEITGDEMEGQADTTPPPAAPTDNWQPPEGKAIKDLNMENVDQHHGHQGGGEDAPMTERHGAGTARTDGQGDERVNPETGEVLESVHEIEHKKDEPWREWCSRLLGYIRAESKLDDVEQWVAKNKKTIEQLVKDAPKIHAQLAAAIGKHKQGIIIQREQKAEQKGEQEEPPFNEGEGDGRAEREDRAE